MDTQRPIDLLVNEVIADGKITREEKKRIDEALLADGRITDRERAAIARLLELLATGQVVMDD